jgi:hypothetical protein
MFTEFVVRCCSLFVGCGLAQLLLLCLLNAHTSYPDRKCPS